MASVTVLLRNGVVHLRLTENRKSAFISLGRKVDEPLFKTNALSGWVSAKHPDAPFINAVIEDKRQQAVAFITSCELNRQPVILADLVAAIKGKASATTVKGFLQAITDRANYHYGNNATGSYYKYGSVRKQIEAAWGRDYTIEQITKKEVEKFVLFRRQNNIHSNTIRKDLSFLATVWAQHGKGDNPFKQLKIAAVPTKKEKLTKDEIARIESVKLSGLAELAKDMGLFSYYAQGMRFENVALIPANCLKGGKLVYQMNKGKKHREIEAHEKMIALVTKYKGGGKLLFPLVKKMPKNAWELRDVIGSANSEINKYLKVVAAAAGIVKPLTVHIFRHTFAYHALKHGASYAVLKDALGHSSYHTTQIYLDSLSDDDINNSLKGMFD